MSVHEFILISDYDGLEISCLISTPDSKPSAILQISHGMCGCKERYLPFMQYMASRGIACVTNDHRGHGSSIKSSEDLGYMYEGGYEALIQDMKLVTEHVMHLYPSLPFYLLGHSMGSLAAILYAADWSDRLSGLILCGIPYCSPAVSVSSFLLSSICRFGGGYVRLPLIQNVSSGFYNRRFRKEGFQAWTCSDPEAREAFMSDPKCNFSFTANGAMNLLAMLHKASEPGVMSRADKDLDILILHGTDDPCTAFGRSVSEFSVNLIKSGLNNVKKIAYQHLRHEILNEIGKETVWNDIFMFMQ